MLGSRNPDARRALMDAFAAGAGPAPQTHHQVGFRAYAICTRLQEDWDPRSATFNACIASRVLAYVRAAGGVSGFVHAGCFESKIPILEKPALIVHARYRARQLRARRLGSAAPRHRSRSPRPTAASAPCWTAGLKRGRRRSCPSSRPRPTSASWHFDCWFSRAMLP